METLSLNKYVSSHQILLEKDIFKLDQIVELIKNKITKGKCNIIIAGNGGSHSTSNYYSFELNKIENIHSLPISNDYSYLSDSGYKDYDNSYLNYFKSKNMDNPDILFFISGSGNSKNLIEMAKYYSDKTTLISFLGRDGGKLTNLSMVSVISSSDDMEIIENVHMFYVDYIIEELKKWNHGK